MRLYDSSRMLDKIILFEAQEKPLSHWCLTTNLNADLFTIRALTLNTTTKMHGFNYFRDLCRPISKS